MDHPKRPIMPISPPNRRQFLAGLSATALVAATHPPAAWSDTGSIVQPKGTRLIRHLRLLTDTPLAEMKAFYHGALGFEVATEQNRSITFRTGDTGLTFSLADAPAGHPFYHFAFNIPENKLLRARQWQLERTPLFLTPDNLRDPDYPDDVRHFRHWNAHSVFFFDPARNVVEYIARHDLDNAAEGDFGTDDILYASEIAFVTNDVPALAGELQTSFGLPQYRRGNDHFRAIGDENGLLLVFETGRQIGDRLAGDDRGTKVFPTVAEVQRASDFVWKANDLPYKIAADG